ncbi:aldolase/citrate lyase family protein [Variovorax sp. LjRoot130]|uniref:aldolase/citrate lyase family protein n=1 Tax=Variovorax sp. LjRoot130 TaxID=3342261 RepID=UPI003ECFEEE3
MAASRYPPKGEHPRAIENIDDILAVEGLDGVIAAPLDLPANMGFVGQPSHPQVQEAMEHVRRRILARGFPIVAFAVTPDRGRVAIAEGASMLFVGFDTMKGPHCRRVDCAS